MKRVLCGFAAFLVATATVAQAPVNDNPAGAIPVFDGINPGAPTGASGSFFSNINATDTSPYGTPCGSTNHSDVFFLYTPSVTGTHVISTCTPAGFQAGRIADTTVAVYNVTSPTTSLGCDDDGCITTSPGTSGFLSRVAVALTSGSSYYFRVASWSGAVQGEFYLNVLPPTTGNEDCATATLISDGSYCGQLFGATASGTTIAGCTNFLATTVDQYWAYVAPFTGECILTREGGPATMRTYFSTGTCGAEVLEPTTCVTGTGYLHFPVVGGTVYYLRFGTTSTTHTALTGVYDFSIATVLPNAANDTCAGALPIGTGDNYAVMLGMTADAATPACATNFTVATNLDGWFMYTASVASTVVFTLSAPQSTYQMAVYTGGACGALTGPLCPTTGTNALVQSTPATGGQVFYVRAGATTAASGGVINLRVDEIPPPANDDCTGAFTVADGVNPTAGTYSNFAALDDPGYSAAACAAAAVGSKGVWFLYVASTTGMTAVATCTPGTVTAGTLTDTIVEVFDNCGGGFTSIACNDNSCGNLSNVNFASSAGSPYWIRVSSKTTTASGTFYLQINPVPTNDECFGALPIGLGANGPLLHLGATTSTPAPSCSANSNDIWYVFTAPDTGTLKINTCGTNFDAVLSVYDATCTGVQLACDDDDLNNGGPCATTETLNSYLTLPVTSGTSYLIRVGNFSATTFGQIFLNLAYKFSFSITKPAPFDVELKDFAGTPGNLFLNAVTLNMGAFPNGWFYGIDIPVQELLAEVNVGTPFFGVLNGLGQFSQTFTGIPFLGLTFYTRGVEFTPGGIFVQLTDAVAWTI